MLGGNWAMALHPDDYARSVAAWTQAFQTGKPYFIEYRIRRAIDGEYCWFQQHALPLRDDAGNIVRWYGTCTDIHERKVAEEAARIGKERLESALMASSMGALDWDMATDHITVVGEVERLLGLAPGEFDGTYACYKRSIHPDDHAGVRAVFALAIASHTRRSHEYRIVWPDGSIHWIEGQGEFFYNEAGQAVRMVGTIQSIDARRQAQEAIRESEERFRAIYEQSAIPVTVFDLTGRYLMANKAACVFSGYTEEEILASRLQDMVSPDLRGAVEERLGSLRSGEKTGYEVERSFHRKDGTAVWGYASTSVVTDAAGTPAYAVSIMEDITARKQAEQQLQLAAEAARLGVWSWDTASGKTFWSREMYSLFGIAPTTTVYRERILASVHPDDRDRVDQASMTAFTERTIIETEFRVLLADGTERWVTSRGRWALTAEGKPLRWEGVAFDTSERKNLEQQYLQAQKMEGIGRLAGGVAHDFNNLLAVILGYAQMVAEELDEGSPLLTSVHNIEKAATRAATLTKQLLAFARRQITVPKVFRPNDLLNNMGAMLRPLIGEQIELGTHLQSNLGLVEADPNQIEQVIVNLVVNARDAMPGGGKLFLKTENATLADIPLRQNVKVAPGEYVMLSITDTGTGMTEAVKARLFEPFFSTKEVGKGTGLGMATCYGIVKQHRGYLFVFSEVGIGTTVKVFLPRVDPREASLDAAAVEGSAPHGTEMVLVVEDEPLLRQLTVSTLCNHGYTVLEAEDGAEALRIAGEHEGPINLLLSDMIMPNMGGQELARRLKDVRPETRVMFVSGYSEETFNAKAALPPDMPLLPKPFTSRALLTKIREVLES